MSITIDIDEQLLAELGQEEVERELQQAIERLERRQLARQVLDGIKDIDLSNDPAYQQAREKAWEQYKRQQNLAMDGSRPS